MAFGFSRSGSKAGVRRQSTVVSEKAVLGQSVIIGLGSGVEDLMNSIFAIWLMVAPSFVLQDGEVKEYLYYSNIDNEARRTQRNYEDALKDGREELPKTVEPEIPKRYWTPEIRKLKPIRIYTHYINMVLVLKIVDGVEQGVYVGDVRSSWMPMPGTYNDGFQFVRPRTSLINFRRTVNKKNLNSKAATDD
jgi:hypothetical protein